MSKTKHRPGIHLFKNTLSLRKDNAQGTQWYWHIVAKNGRIIARSSETYTRKGSAVKSIKIAAKIFTPIANGFYNTIYDHSKPDSKLKSYL